MVIFPSASPHGPIRRRSADAWQYGTIAPRDPNLPETTNLLRRSPRLGMLLLTVLLAVLAGRAFYVALALPNLEERARANHLRTYVTRAYRGVIADVDGTPLVRNDARDDLALIPADVPRDPVVRARMFETMRSITGINTDDALATLEQYRYLYTPVTIATDLTNDQKVALTVAFPEDANGVTVVRDFRRNYLGDTTAFSHLLGYVAKISADEYPALASRYRPSDEIGKTGLEAAWEETLRGDDGERRISVNAHGEKDETLATTEASSGCNLLLNVRASFQERVQTILRKHLRAGGFDAGVVIVLDPRSGAVRAIVNQPTYDHRMFADGIKGDEVPVFERLIGDPNTPFLDRAIGGVYPPGSTFKLVTAATALERGAVTATERIDSPGQIVVASEIDPTTSYTYKGWKAAGHGRITVVEAISESSDTFFYQVIGGFEDRRGTGPLPLAEDAQRFGYGTPLGIDLAGEVGGTVPSPEWKSRTIRSNPSWFQGDTYNFSIGQGYLLATPLQVAAMTSVVANGGTLYRPQVVRAITNCADAAPILPYTLRAQVASSETIRRIAQGMRRAVTDDTGTAKALRDAAVPVAGKTGTAQYANNLKEHAWFTMFAPADRPEVVITVLVEGGGEGSLTALPVAREVLDAYLGSS